MAFCSPLPNHFLETVLSSKSQSIPNSFHRLEERVELIFKRWFLSCLPWSSQRNYGTVWISDWRMLRGGRAVSQKVARILGLEANITQTQNATTTAKLKAATGSHSGGK